MTPAELIRDLACRGVHVCRSDFKLRWAGPADVLTPEDRERLRLWKWAVLAELAAAESADPDHWRFVFNERAAIGEYCGDLSRPEAERLAFEALNSEVVGTDFDGTA